MVAFLQSCTRFYFSLLLFIQKGRRNCEEVKIRLVKKDWCFYVKSVHIRRFFGPHFPTFGLNTERYFVSLRIQSKCGKIRTRKSPNTDTFHTVRFFQIIYRYTTLMPINPFHATVLFLYPLKI